MMLGALGPWLLLELYRINLRGVWVGSLGQVSSLEIENGFTWRKLSKYFPIYRNINVLSCVKGIGLKLDSKMLYLKK